MAEQVAVLASGGLDSAVLIAESARNADVFPLYVQWGLPWEEMEKKSLQTFVSALKNRNVKPVTFLSVPIKEMYPPDHWSMTGKVPSYDEPDETVFLPGRNIILIGLAAVWCSTHGVSRIAIGSLGGNPFPDATPQFFQDFGKILSSGLGYIVKVEAPFRGQHKEELIRRHPELPFEKTLTCFAPVDGNHCGRCNKCRERREAFVAAGIRDRTVYAG